MKGAVDIPIFQLLIAYGFVALTIIVSSFFKLSRDKEIIIATIRMSVQLFIIGYVLKYIFDKNIVFLAVALICLMEGFAVNNAIKRAKVKLRLKLKIIAGVTLVTCSLVSLAIFLFAVIGIRTFNTRYVIGICGMLLGNSMTGLSIAMRTLAEGMSRERTKVESALMLGATPFQSCSGIIKESFTMSAMPNINSMMGMGIVSLPGMMTGQILSGMSPLVSTKYQIAILLGQSGTITLCCASFLILGYKTFFNKRCQLI
ncbi:MAG TPA: iron export ABC transporter permease subunit FetB [Ruminiclostridium sp.]|nr:iron export ABC transporter permease subunit FetB [Ruminiclostridium sp.]